MGASLLLLLLPLSLVAVAAAASLQAHYLVMFPAVMHHGQEEKLCIHLSNLADNVQLAVTLQLPSHNHSLLQLQVHKPGTFQCLPFQVPELLPRKRDGSPSHQELVAHLHALVHTGDKVHFEGHKKVLLEPPRSVVLVQTDKGLYKPGETVRFRVVNVDEELKVIRKEYAQIWLEDPGHNRIAEWKNVIPSQGLVDLSFPLASEAALGEYTISVQHGLAQQTFEVEEYVLSKVEVNIVHPPFINPADEEFQLKVCARYTYGKPAHGKVELVALTLFSFLEGSFSSSLGARTQESMTGQDGCAAFSLQPKALALSEMDGILTVVAQLVEDGSGAEAMGTVRIPISSRPNSIVFVNLHLFYKPGLPYTGKMLCQSGNSPLQNETVYLIVNVNEEEESHLSLLTDDKGEAHFSLDTTSWNSTMVSLKGAYSLEQVASSESYSGAAEAFHWLKPFYSESNSFLEIKAKDEEMPCEQQQQVHVDYLLNGNKLSSAADHLDFYYLLIAKGKILSSGEKQVPITQQETLQGSFSLPLPVGTDFLPALNLLLYALLPDGEVLADVERFQVEECFRHKVSLDFSHKEQVPGSTVSLKLQAAPGSLCSVQAVDKSVLLRSNNTLTAKALSEALFEDSFTLGGRGFPYRLEDFEGYPCLPQQHSLHKKASLQAPWYQSDADVFSLFKKLRLKILTNTRVKKPVSCERPGLMSKMYDAEDNLMVENMVGQAEPAPASAEKKEPKARSHFPESWIWDLVSVGEDGQASLQVTVPDTITEWNANTFCVASTGFGLSPLTSLRVFQPFFVDLSLPYSVIQGETFSLKATVFNYLKECIQVHTRLLESPELKVEACPSCLFSSCLCANEAKSFEWNVTGSRLGRVNVSVSSTADGAQPLCGNKLAVTPSQGQTDTVIKPLLVKPGGVLQEKTQNAFLCAADNTVSKEISLTLPEEVLEGSGRATVSVIGDIMGPALQNLDSLLKMPFGCGEQNMVQFAPNIFVLQYLNKTKQLDPEIRQKALKFLKTGYQRQLLYKHQDGSYSAFGKADSQGNTWLTAFVARSFGQASSYIYIGQEHVQSALLWLQQHQLPSGCFQSVGKLFNNDLKGGVDDTVSLTAYIAAALLELPLQKNDTMLDNALACLRNVTLEETNLYVKALMAYVFTLAKDMEMREQLMERLEKETASLLTAHSRHEEPSSMIETVAYILLAHVSKPGLAPEGASVTKLVHWLSGQRNAFGGFASTQDTVVSLQALAQYAALIPQEIKEVKVTVEGKEASSALEFHVHSSNRLVLHQAPLLAIPGLYTVHVAGTGCVYLQVALFYNIPPPKTEELFVLDVQAVPKACDGVRKQLDIQLSVSYVGERQSTNMALLEVEMLSGFIPVKSSIKALEEIALVKKTEIEPDKVTIYLEELVNTPLELKFSVEQDVEVQDLKAATVHVYDYYKPDDHTAREYAFPCPSAVLKNGS